MPAAVAAVEQRDSGVLRRRASSMLLACGLSACGHAPPGVTGQPASASDARSAAVIAALPVAAEDASASRRKPGWVLQRQGVAAAHPLAAQAGLDMLRAGGSALDAAVAVQAVLSLVEPQSSGLGGGAFLMHWDGRQVQAWDGRETAPAAADPGSFLRADGTPLPPAEAVTGGRAVGVPGVMKMLQAAHRQHGRLPWAQLFGPAIALAEAGFPVGERLHSLLASNATLRQDALARAYFYRPDGSPHPVGHRLRNPALAAVLRQLAARGSDALHGGPVAADMVARVQQHRTPGALSLADLAGYQPLQRTPLCTDWRAFYRVCGMPPPSSGHLMLMQLLGLLDASPASPSGPTAAAVHEPWPDVLADLARPVPAGATAWHAWIEAGRLALADRAQFVADPGFVPAPGGDWQTLLAPAYLQQRAALLRPQQRLDRAEAGQPGGPGDATRALGPMAPQPEAGTSHISIVDAQGQALAMTSSVEAAFGARILADGGTGLPGGYILNNHLTDFSYSPTDAAGRPVANRLQGGKRPRSSMTPTLVFDRRDSRLLMVLGSPGGPLIPFFVARTLLVSLVGGQDMQRAIDAPHVGDAGGPVLLEKGRFSPALAVSLQQRGHRVLEVDLPSGLHGLQRTPKGWLGGADPRREGVVAGD